MPAGALLWEAFVFPFHPQTELIRTQLDGIGRVREIASRVPLHRARSGRTSDGRPHSAAEHCATSAATASGSARLLFDAEPTEVAARAFIEHGVDAEIAAVVDFPGRATG